MLNIPVNLNILLSALDTADHDSLIHHINDISIFRNYLNIPHPYTKEDAARFIKICHDQNIRYSTINNMAFSRLRYRRNDRLHWGIF